jgi:phosphoribosylformimino-5-aminoimidazole carboxamide ribotide isomerase
VARALLRLERFPAFYIADLDAITQGGSDSHLPVLVEIVAELGRSGVGELWLDAGLAPWLGLLAQQTRAHGLTLVMVAGAESLAASAAPPAGWHPPDAADWVLSLDYRAGSFLGPPGLDANATAWPTRVIVMELSAVGAVAGPALARLDALASVAAATGRDDIAFFAGGGVRDVADLHMLKVHGAAGALVASALHDGHLDAATLEHLAQQ